MNRCAQFDPLTSGELNSIHIHYTYCAVWMCTWKEIRRKVIERSGEIKWWFGFDFFLLWICEPVIHSLVSDVIFFQSNCFSSGLHWSNDISQVNNIVLKMINEINGRGLVKNHAMLALAMLKGRIYYKYTRRIGFFFLFSTIFLLLFFPSFFPLFEFISLFCMEYGNSTTFTSQRWSDKALKILCARRNKYGTGNFMTKNSIDIIINANDKSLFIDVYIFCYWRKTNGVFISIDFQCTAFIRYTLLQKYCELHTVEKDSIFLHKIFDEWHFG